MPDRRIRAALWFSVAYNAFGAVLFGSIAAGRPLMDLPVPIAPLYAAQLTLTIALFGGVYAWLARQREIDRPLLFVSGLGKIGFFTVFVVYWLVGDVAAQGVMQASPDLVLGVIFLAWLRSKAARHSGR